MLTIENIDLSQVQPENFAELAMMQDAIDGAIEQGRQGWGVRREQAVMLGLTRQLVIALRLADTADEAQRALKGAQMSLGRITKQRDELADTLNQATLAKVETNARLDGLGKRIKALEEDKAKLAYERDELALQVQSILDSK